MSIELGQGTGPLRGVKVVEIAGIGPGPHACMILADLGADVIRVERPGGQLLAGGAARRCSTAAGPASRSTSRTPTRWRPCSTLVARRRRAGRGACGPASPSGSGSAPSDCLARNPRLVYGRMTGWGQAGPLAAGRRPRHELHRDHRRAVRPRPGPGPAALPDQPGRRLRRRLDVPRHRRPRRAARGPGQRPGPGRRRRDRRRHRPPQRDDRGVPGGRQPTRGARAPTSSTAARPYYDLYETADGRHMSRRARWSRSSTTSSSSCSASRTPRPTAYDADQRRRAARADHRDVRGSAPRPSGSRSSRAPTPASRRRPPAQRGRRAPAPEGPRDLRRARRPSCSPRPPRASPAPRRASASRPPPRPAPTPARRWPPGASPTSTR